jgi:hypothetical protein
VLPVQQPGVICGAHVLSDQVSECTGTSMALRTPPPGPKLRVV